MNLRAIPRKTLLGKTLRLPLGLVPADACLPILQGRLKGKKWIAGSFFPACWLGTYEYKTRLLFERLIPTNAIVFDIGAHVGYFTLLASILVGPRGRVFAFEPLPRNLAYLNEHLRLNKVTNVQVIDAAVSDAEGTAAFDQGPDKGRGSYARISSLGRIRGDPRRQLQVRTLTLDAEFAKGALPLPQYMKIDVESGETRVLFGAQSLLLQARPTIFLSTHGPEVHEQCCDLLRGIGYTLTPLDADDLSRAHEVLAN